MFLSWVVLINYMSKDNKNKSTEVANVNVNVADEATSINNLISNDMFEDRNEVAQTTRIAYINGEEKSIVIAHTKFGMELPKDKKNLIEKIDCNKMLNCIYHFATPEIFWNEGIELLDEENNVIEKDTENVFVSCPTADSFWRMAVEEKLQNVEIHTFKSVEEYAQTIGCTNLYSRGLSNTEKMGIAALATGDNATMAVFEFAKKYNMPITTAQLYFDYKLKSTMLMSMTMGEILENIPTLGRTVEDATALFEQTKDTFKKNAMKRYAIRSINMLLHKDEYSFDEMMETLKIIPSNEIEKAESAPCEDKQQNIASLITKWLITYKQKVQKEAA